MWQKQEQKVLLYGNSGGKDSATVIAMAVKALGSDKVLAVTMPCESKSEDMLDAKSVTDKFEVKTINVDLNSSFQSLKGEINLGLEDRKLSNEALINIKPRLRMTTLYRNCTKFRIFSNRYRKLM